MSISLERYEKEDFVDFLSVHASVMFNQGIVSNKTLDQLKIILSDFTSNKGMLIDSNQIFSDLEFINFLDMRYLPSGWIQNLLRFSLNKEIVILKKTLSDLGLEVLEKSKLLFNRTVDVSYHDRFPQGSIDSQRLATSILSNFVNCIQGSIFSLSDMQNQLAYFLPHNLAISHHVDDEIDEEIANGCGFKNGVRGYYSKKEEKILRKNLGNMIEPIAKILEEISEIFVTNKKNSSQRGLIYGLCEEFTWENKKFQEIEFSSFEMDRVILNNQRKKILDSFTSLTATIQKLSQSILQLLDQTVRTAPASTFPVLTQALLYQFTGILLAKGIVYEKAEEAVQALAKYCENHKISYSKIIPQELHSIHPILGDNSRSLLELWNPNALSENAIKEKKNSLKKMEEMKIFLLKCSLPIFLCVLATSIFSCGLKTMPKSDILEKRPALPFNTIDPVKGSFP